MFAPGFAPYAASENLVSSKLALAMLDRGWHVDVISRQDEGFNYGQDWVEPWLPLRPFTHEIVATRDKAPWRQISRGWHSLRMGHPLAGVRWASEAVDLAMDLHRQQRYDVVLSRAVSGLAHLPALRFCHKTQVPWIANWNDPPGYFFPPPYAPTGNPIDRFFWKRFLLQAASRANFNTFPSGRLARYVLGRLGLTNEDNVRIIPHVMMPGFQADSLPPSECFRLCHAGNLSAERNPGGILSALSRFKASPAGPVSFRLEFIGVEDVGLASLIAQHGLKDNVRFTGRLNYIDTLRRLAGNDVLVIVEAPCEEGIFLPSKLMDYVQAQRPVLSISPLRGTIRDLLSAHGGGLAVDVRSPDGILAALRGLYRQWQENQLGVYRSEALTRMFSPQTILDQYEALFEALRLRKQT